MSMQQLRLTARLWYLGLRESLQLQRCLVLLALDDENVLWAKVRDCIKLHGAIFLGSLAWWQCAVEPSCEWVLQTLLAPVAGQGTAQTVSSALKHVGQVLWIAPAYAVTLLVSFSWYNDIAQRAVTVRTRHNARLKAEASATNGATAPTNSAQQAATVSTNNTSHSPYEDAAQELYRVTLFAVFYAEVSLAALIPVVGPGIAFLLTCWLYAYYCYDYTWTLRGVKLKDRLALFEGCAPFFAGYGLILAAVTTFLPFFLGAAVMSLLFPVFVMVACDSNAAGVISQELGLVGQDGKPIADAKTRLYRVPVFQLAAWPTQAILRRLGPKKTA